MSVYNSSDHSNQDDVNTTMTNLPYLNDHDNQPITTEMPVLRRPQRTTQSKPLNNRTDFNDRQDYVYVDQDSVETAKQLERILKFYRQELKQESNTQTYCDQQLLTRLIDFIRPVYSSNRDKLNDLDVLYEELSTLHDVRLIDQKEKTEQLQTEIAHLKKLIITSAHEDDRRNNTTTQIYRINSMINFEQWMEMEEETKKLHNLVEAQRDKINELVKLLSKEETLPLQRSASTTIIAPLDETSTNNQRSTASNTNVESTLVARVRALADQEQDTGMNLSKKSTSELYSPGSSPIHSLNDFLTKSLVDTVNHETQNEERPTVATRVLPLLSRISSYNPNNNTRSCFICNHEFVSTANEFEIISHVDKCLSSVGIDDVNVAPEPKQYDCPKCNRQYPGDEEKAYLEHLSVCLRDDVEAF